MPSSWWTWCLRCWSKAPGESRSFSCRSWPTCWCWLPHLSCWHSQDWSPQCLGTRPVWVWAKGVQWQRSLPYLGALIGNIVAKSLELFSERFKIQIFHVVVQPSNQQYPQGPHFTPLLYLSGKKLVLHGGSRDRQPVHLRTFSRTEYPPHPWVGGTRARCCQNEICPVRSPWVPGEGP